MDKANMTVREIDAELYRRFKAQVMLAGKTVREVVIELIHEWTAQQEQKL